MVRLRLKSARACFERANWHCVPGIGADRLWETADIAKLVADAEVKPGKRGPYLVGGQIVRVGSSKGRLATRLRAWQNDISRALQGRKSPAPQVEADKWRSLLSEHGEGFVFARSGTIVDTPIGRISTYLNEECALIERYRPTINRSWR